MLIADIAYVMYLLSLHGSKDAPDQQLYSSDSVARRAVVVSGGRRWLRMSRGTGNTMVELFSAAMLLRVCR